VPILVSPFIWLDDDDISLLWDISSLVHRLEALLLQARAKILGRFGPLGKVDSRGIKRFPDESTAFILCLRLGLLIQGIGELIDVQGTFPRRLPWYRIGFDGTAVGEAEQRGRFSRPPAGDAPPASPGLRRS
jgi:hypothetical protein